MHTTLFRSLVLRTETIFWRHSSHIIERPDYIVIDTPKRRGWYWGNILIFPAPPAEGDFERWRSLFTKEFSDPNVQHMFFAWDRTDGELGCIEPFLQAGFELDRSVMLTAERVHLPPNYSTLATIRRLESEEEYEQAIAIQVDCRDPRFPVETYTAFVRGSMENYRRLIDAGLGAWYGAFLDGRVVGDLGLFFDGDVGRFQNVGTAPDHRRQGICGRLVHDVAREAFANGRARQLTMVADESYHAARIYESIGFAPTERFAGVFYYPERPVSAAQP